MKMRKYTKALLAVLLVLSVVVSMVAQPGLSAKASNGDYKEMKFGDWGTAAGTAGGLNIYSLTDPSTITSLDGVAISSTINLKGQSWGNSLITVGGIDTAKDGGFWLVSTGGEWGLGSNYIGTDIAWSWLDNSASVCKTNGNVVLRMTFDKAENANNWTVNVYADGTKVGTVTYKGVTPGLYIGIAPNISVDMTPSAAPAPTYNEMYFSDWGTDAGTSDGLDIYSLTKSDAINSLDGVAISGKVHFNGNAANYFRVGGTEAVKHAGFSLMTQEDTGRLIIWAQGIGTDFAHVVLDAEDWAELIDTEITLRMAFFKDATTGVWTVEVHMNDNLIGTYNFSSVTPGLYIANSGVQIERESVEPTYTEMYFSDWGTDAGTSEGFDILSLTNSDAIDSLDGVAINGKVNFNGSGFNYFRIGGTESVKHAGFSLMTQEGTGRLIIWAQGIGTDFADVVLEAEDWAKLMDSDVVLRIVFSKATNANNWTISIHMNGELVKTSTFNSVEPGLYIANQGVTLQGEYKELQFSDWGTSVGTSEGYNIFSLSNSELIDSLDGVAISGKANFNGQAYKWLTIGGTEDVKHAGFWLGAVQENGWTMACQGIGADAGDSVQWSEAAKFDQEVELRLTFNKATDSDTWTVGVYADGAIVGTWTYSDVTPGLYIGIDPSLTVEGLEVKAPEVPKFSDTYKELTFDDFGIYAGVVEKTDIYTLKGHGDIASLSGVAISGKVNYNDVVDGRISIGGTDQFKHAGFWLFSDGSHLRLSPQGIGDVVIDHFLLSQDEWTSLKNKEIDLRLTFNKEKTTSEWWVGVYINGQEIGIVNCGTVAPGLYLGVHPSVAVEGLGDAVKNGGIDFTLFGYSNNNWRKEMGLK